MRYKCGICIEKLSNPVLIRECGHLFCERCLNQWAQVRQNGSNNSCPFCRTDYTARGLIKVSYASKPLIQNAELYTKKAKLEKEVAAKRKLLTDHTAKYNKIIKNLEDSVKSAESRLQSNKSLEQNLHEEMAIKQNNVQQAQQKLTVCRNFFKKVAEKRLKPRHEPELDIKMAYDIAARRIFKCRTLVTEKRAKSDEIAKSREVSHDLKQFFAKLGQERLEEALTYEMYTMVCSMMGWTPKEKAQEKEDTVVEEAEVSEEQPIPTTTSMDPEKLNKKLAFMNRDCDPKAGQKKTANPFEKLRMLSDKEKRLHLPKENQKTERSNFPNFIFTSPNKAGEDRRNDEKRPKGQFDLRYAPKKGKNQGKMTKETKNATIDDSLFEQLQALDTVVVHDHTTLNMTVHDATLADSPFAARQVKFNRQSFENRRKTFTGIGKNETIHLDSDEDIVVDERARKEALVGKRDRKDGEEDNDRIDDDVLVHRTSKNNGYGKENGRKRSEDRDIILDDDVVDENMEDMQILDTIDLEEAENNTIKPGNSVADSEGTSKTLKKAARQVLVPTTISKNFKSNQGLEKKRYSLEDAENHGEDDVDIEVKKRRSESSVNDRNWQNQGKTAKNKGKSAKINGKNRESDGVLTLNDGLGLKVDVLSYEEPCTSQRDSELIEKARKTSEVTAGDIETAKSASKSVEVVENETDFNEDADENAVTDSENTVGYSGGLGKLVKKLQKAPELTPGTIRSNKLMQIQKRKRPVDQKLKGNGLATVETMSLATEKRPSPVASSSKIGRNDKKSPAKPDFGRKFTKINAEFGKKEQKLPLITMNNQNQKLISRKKPESTVVTKRPKFFVPKTTTKSYVQMPLTKFCVPKKKDDDEVITLD
ncbi:unnamed protein product [Bursaphelenchus okinawaensis]|uniref:RING-type domain-containing protein n=1 Tax=Bursaphelenchus okinawaensis TaxID=465554 RepID=A0A811LBG0_9BILA|nr:unnamed protein product [Bursaphelenchus okinawaensis]CAG9121237.1 unnamed protein product [Bursaphelenchus okinawaensis]